MLSHRESLERLGRAKHLRPATKDRLEPTRTAKEGHRSLTSPTASPTSVVHRCHPHSSSPPPKGQLHGRPPRRASASGCTDHWSAEHRCPSMAVPAPRHETGSTGQVKNIYEIPGATTLANVRKHSKSARPAGQIRVRMDRRIVPDELRTTELATLFGPVRQEPFSRELAKCQIWPVLPLTEFRELPTDLSRGRFPR